MQLCLSLKGWICFLFTAECRMMPFCCYNKFRLFKGGLAYISVSYQMSVFSSVRGNQKRKSLSYGFNISGNCTIISRGAHKQSFPLCRLDSQGRVQRPKSSLIQGHLKLAWNSSLSLPHLTPFFLWNLCRARSSMNEIPSLRSTNLWRQSCPTVFCCQTWWHSYLERCACCFKQIQILGTKRGSWAEGPLLASRP